MKAHALAWVGDPTREEAEGMELWLEELRRLRRDSPDLREAWEDYTIHPSDLIERDSASGVILTRRFSCAGFVERCYAEGAGIRLVRAEALPNISRESLQQIWPRPDEQDPSEFGLVGEGPWPILLPAHLLHALARADARTPYEPRPEDWAF